MKLDFVVQNPVWRVNRQEALTKKMGRMDYDGNRKLKGQAWSYSLFCYNVTYS